MKKCVCAMYALPLIVVLSAAAVRAEDKPAMPATPAPAADKDVDLTGQIAAKKKDAAANVVATLKVDGVVYQLVPKDDDAGKQIKAAMNTKADVKGTLKGDTITVASAEKKTPGKKP